MADVIVMWGSNARETHPSSSTTCWRPATGARGSSSSIPAGPRRRRGRERWLGLQVGTDIALAKAVAHEIIHAGLVNRAFVERATSGFEEYRARRRALDPGAGREDDRCRCRAISPPWPTPTAGPTGPACAGRSASPSTTTASTTSSRSSTSPCSPARWVGRQRAQPAARPEQRARRRGHGRHPRPPARVPGRRGRRGTGQVRPAWGITDPAPEGASTSPRCSTPWRTGELRAVYCLGENPAQSEADIDHARRLLGGLDHLVVQDIFLTKTAEMADVVLPAPRRGAKPRAR